MAIPENGAPGAPTGGFRVLGLLLLVYVINMIDRHIVSILTVPIQRDLLLTNTQMGLLGGFAFVVLYTTAGIPIAWLSDRYNRTTIIAACLSVWSLFTGFSGWAANFTQLLCARIGVGIGEAGALPASHSLISDYFPPARRARALAVLSLGAPIGTALGIFFGGWVATTVGWRAAFLVIGLAGLVLVPIFKWAVIEPARGRHDGDAGTGAATPQSFGVSAGTVLSSPIFWLLATGAGIAAIPSSGLVFWLPTFFQRGFGLDLSQASMFYGSIMLVGGIAGTYGGGWVSDKLGARTPAAYGLVPACAFLLAVPTCLLALDAPSLLAAWLLFVFWQALAIAWLGPVVAAVQQIFMPNMRAMASAGFLLVNNIVGAGFGTFVLGFMADRMVGLSGGEALRQSMQYSLGGYVVGAALLAMASVFLARHPLIRMARAHA
ncbi:MAG: MFS transporter [Novosphingobium sp.]